MRCKIYQYQSKDIANKYSQKIFSMVWLWTYYVDRVRACECVLTNTILCCWRFSSGSFRVYTNTDPLFSSAIMLLTELWLCFWSITEKMPSAYTHTHISHDLIWAFLASEWIEKKKLKHTFCLGRKSERISDMLCNRIPYSLLCVCGWCANSLRLQIQSNIQYFLSTKLKLISKCARISVVLLLQNSNDY